MPLTTTALAKFIISKKKQGWAEQHSRFPLFWWTVTKRNNKVVPHANIIKNDKSLLKPWQVNVPFFCVYLLFDIIIYRRHHDVSHFLIQNVWYAFIQNEMASALKYLNITLCSVIDATTTAYKRKISLKGIVSSSIILDLAASQSLGRNLMNTMTFENLNILKENL